MEARGYLRFKKSAKLILGGKHRSQNPLGWLIVGRTFLSVNCSKFLLKLALRTYIFLKLSHANILSIWTEEIQAKTKEWTTQTAIDYTDCNHLAHVIVLCMCYCTIFALFYFKFEGNFWVQAPGGLYSEGRFNAGFFALSPFSPPLVFRFSCSFVFSSCWAFSRLHFDGKSF